VASGSVASNSRTSCSHELPPNRRRRYPRGTSRKRHQSCSTRTSALIARRRHAECGTLGLLPPPKFPPDGSRRAILRGLPDAQTRHNRNFQPSTVHSYGRIGAMASSVRAVPGLFPAQQTGKACHPGSQAAVCLDFAAMRGRSRSRHPVPARSADRAVPQRVRAGHEWACRIRPRTRV
jgi:hypothetical protein